MSQLLDRPPSLFRLQKPLLIAGLGGLAICAIGAFFNLGQFFRSYLVAYLFWVGIAIDCLGILMMQYLTGGAWGLILRRTLESASLTLPLLLLLFAPLLFGLSSLYVWARPAEVAADPLLQHKEAYLNVPFFLIRALVYFLVWIGAAYLVWLGIQSWRTAGRAAEAPPRHRVHISRGFLVAITNPKTIAFFTAFLPQFVDPALPVGWQLFVMCTVSVVLAGVTDAAWAIAAGLGRAWFMKPKHNTLLGRLSGAVLIGGGLWLSLARRT